MPPRPSTALLVAAAATVSACSAAPPSAGAASSPPAYAQLPAASVPPSASAIPATTVTPGVSAASSSPVASSGPASPPPGPPGPARVLWVVEPVDNTGRYKLSVVPGGPVRVVGQNQGRVTSADDLFVEALAEDGATLWHKAGTAKSIHAVSGTSAHFFFGSEFFGNVDFAGVRASVANTGSFIVRLDDAGALAWARVLDTPDFTRMGPLAATPDGGVAAAVGIFVAAKKGPLAVPIAGGEDTVLVKYDSAGQAAWVKTFGWAGYDEPVALFAAPDGDLLLVGTRWKSPDTQSGALAEGRCHGWATRLDPSGAPRWSVDLGADTTRVTVDRAAPAIGGLVIAGTMRGRDHLGSTTLDAGPRDRGYLAALDKDGQVRWARLRDRPGCLVVDRADRVVLADLKGISVETAAGEATMVLPFPTDTVTHISDCALDGAGNLYLAGLATTGTKIGDKPLTGARLKRRTAWLKTGESGFVAKIAM